MPLLHRLTAYATTVASLAMMVEKRFRGDPDIMTRGAGSCSTDRPVPHLRPTGDATCSPLVVL
jgi:hypothetical protein